MVNLQTCIKHFHSWPSSNHLLPNLTLLTLAGQLWISDENGGDHLLLHCQALHPAQQVQTPTNQPSHLNPLYISFGNEQWKWYSEQEKLTKSLSTARSTSSSTALQAKGSGRAWEHFWLLSSRQKDLDRPTRRQISSQWVRTTRMSELPDSSIVLRVTCKFCQSLKFLKSDRLLAE